MSRWDYPPTCPECCLFMKHDNRITAVEKTNALQPTKYIMLIVSGFAGCHRIRWTATPWEEIEFAYGM